MDGSFVLMDIAAAQLAFERLGRLDRIDVQLARAPTALDASRTPTGAEIDAAVAAIGARLPAGLTAGAPARRGQQVEKMLAAFHVNLAALSWVALVVGLFLVYNTATISVLARREEVGMLRALGVTRRQVLGLFLAEATVLGLAGTVPGIGLGRLLADWAVGVTGATVSTLYVATAAAPPALESPTSRWPWPSACRCRCWRRRFPASRPAARAADGRHPRRRPARDARAPAAADVRRARAGARAPRGARATRAGRRRAALRYRQRMNSRLRSAP